MVYYIAFSYLIMFGLQGSRKEPKLLDIALAPFALPILIGAMLNEWYEKL